MTEPLKADDRASITTVIDGFTAAELALHEVTGAVQRFRGASEQLSEAREDSAAARASLDDVATAIRETAVQLGAAATELHETASALRSIDPERLWLEFDKTQSQQSESATLVVAQLTRMDERLTSEFDKMTAGLAASDAIVDSRMGAIDARLERDFSRVEARHASLEAGTRRLDRTSLAALLVSFTSLALLVAIVAGVIGVR